jgi:hypothetical protein
MMDMRELESRRAAVAFWTLLSAVIVTTLAAVIGHLSPAFLSLDACDACGYLACGLIATAHALPLAAGVMRVMRTPIPLTLVAERA